MGTSFDAYAKQAEHELGDQAADAYKIVNQMLRGMRFHPSQLIDAPADVQTEQPVVSKQMSVDAQRHETEAVRLAADTQVKRQAQNTPESAQQAIAQQTKKLSPDAEAMIKQEHDRKHGSTASQTSVSADTQADDIENDLNLDDYIHRYLEDPASESSSVSASASAAASTADSSASQAAPASSAEPQAVDGVNLVRDQSMGQVSDSSASAGRKTMTLEEALANSQRLQRAAAEESKSDVAAEDAAAQAVVDDRPSDDDIPVDPQNQPHRTEIKLPPMRGLHANPVKTDYHVDPDALASSVKDDDDDVSVSTDVLDDDDSQKSLAELQNNPIIAKKSSMKNTVLVGAVIGVIIVAILAVAFL